ncbi:MAG TPA: AcrB/AcrD/AcrF family protein, partial [Porphyromonadaceae bacterium]|nr:AcrB/AcrD/AcrF family protein [Porphyromonadaceae bacterium]
PKGNSLQNTAAVADSLEALLRKDNRVRSVTSFIGNSSPRFHTSYAPQMPGENYAQFIVNTISSKATEEMLDAYSDTYTNYFPNATLRFKQLDYSEAKAPIEIRVSGNDLEKLKESADTLMGILRKADNLKFVRTNFEDQLPGAYIRLNNDEANRLGVNKTMVSLNMAASYGNGVQLTTLWDNDYPLKVMLKQERYGSDEKMVDIENEYVSSVIPGVSVPLHQIATVEPDWTDGQIVRRNGIRSLSVYADVKRGVNTTAITSEIQKELAQLDLPEGVTLTYGGELETDAESLPQIIGGLSIAVFIIFFILVFHYKKINLSLLTMASILLCVLGAALGILIMGVDFGVTSILGIVSLMGIVVRNGIIMFDYAEQLRLKHGFTAREAAFLSGKRRMRPIFLTSAAASMGVVPMILSKSPLWAPMGSVIFFGTLITMVFLVTILPVSYWLLFRKCDKVKTVNMESI